MGRPNKGTEAYLRYQQKQREAKRSKTKDIDLRGRTSVTLQTSDASSSIQKKPGDERKGKRRAIPTKQDKPTDSKKPKTDVTEELKKPNAEVSMGNEGDLDSLSLLELVDPKRKQSVPRPNAPQRNLSDLSEKILTKETIRTSLC